METPVYLIVRRDKFQFFLDYGYSKNNSKTLYNTRKKKIPNSLRGTIFRNHKLEYEAGVFLDNEFSNIFLFLRSTTERIEENNQYKNSVKLWPVDIDPSEFGENFDPSKIDFENVDREKIKKSVLKVLRKAAALSNQNLIRNAECLLAKRSHNYQDILWVSKKRKHTVEKFSLSY